MSAESYGEESALIKVIARLEHTFHTRCQRTSHLCFRYSRRQLIIPCYKSQWLHCCHTVRYRASENRECSFRRYETLQNYGEPLCPHQCPVIVLAIVETCPHARFHYCMYRFEIHRMEHITAIIIECKVLSVCVPSVAYIPFLHLAESRIYTICILSGINFGKEAFNGGREQQPVSVRRVNASETFELFSTAGRTRAGNFPQYRQHQPVPDHDRSTTDNPDY